MTHVAMLLKIAEEARKALACDSTEASKETLKERHQLLRIDLDWIATRITEHLHEQSQPHVNQVSQPVELKTNRRM